MWVPTFFMTEDTLREAMPRLVTALRPGGWAVLGRFEPMPDPVAQTTTALRTIRGGGCVLDVGGASRLLVDGGCTSVRELDRSGPMPMSFVIGQKPAV